MGLLLVPIDLLLKVKASIIFLRFRSVGVITIKDHVFFLFKRVMIFLDIINSRLSPS